ncbi:hypothetical protein CLU79DRAFT_723048 [Phycomyces nitens]|nr:hypothetical protein CLU79DRAFT_723048 [Phycomyces nitens]
MSSERGRPDRQRQQDSSRDRLMKPKRLSPQEELKAMAEATVAAIRVRRREPESMLIWGDRRKAVIKRFPDGGVEIIVPQNLTPEQEQYEFPPRSQFLKQLSTAEKRKMSAQTEPTPPSSSTSSSSGSSIMTAPFQQSQSVDLDQATISKRWTTPAEPPAQQASKHYVSKKLLVSPRTTIPPPSRQSITSPRTQPVNVRTSRAPSITSPRVQPFNSCARSITSPRVQPLNSRTPSITSPRVQPLSPRPPPLTSPRISAITARISTVPTPRLRPRQPSDAKPTPKPSTPTPLSTMVERTQSAKKTIVHQHMRINERGNHLARLQQQQTTEPQDLGTKKDASFSSGYLAKDMYIMKASA